jgi:ferredoxin
VTPAIFRTGAEDVVNRGNFFNRVLPLYEHGVGDIELERTWTPRRSVVPAATGEPRDFSYIAPEIPQFIASNCVGCMDCVTECPDTAILGKVIPKAQMEEMLAKMPAEQRANR